MQLNVIGSNSQGNCYILQNDSEALIIEAGCHDQGVKKALGFNLTKVAGCLITHEHGDHAKFAHKIAQAGINCYASAGTLGAVELPRHRAKTIKAKQSFKIGNFTVLPFDVKHDAAEPLGFLIHHPETGLTLFLTDTMYSPYTFEGLNNIIVEANYSTELIKQRCEDEMLPMFLRNRIIKSHMSFENTMKLLLANNLTAVNNIVLIHLSDGNSDEAYFKTEASKFLKNVTVASAGMVISNFNKTPF